MCIDCHHGDKKDLGVSLYSIARAIDNNIAALECFLFISKFFIFSLFPGFSFPFPCCYQPLPRCTFDTDFFSNNFSFIHCVCVCVCVVCTHVHRHRCAHSHRLDKGESSEGASVLALSFFMKVSF